MFVEKRERFAFGVFFVLFVLFTFLVAATFTDLIFARKLYAGETGFTAFFDAIGKAPGYLLLGFAACLLSRAAVKDGRAFTEVLRWLYAALAFVGYLLLAESLLERGVDSGKLRYGISAAVSLALTCANLLLFTKIPRETLKLLEKWAVLTAFSLCVIIVLTAGMKYLWGRVRFNALDEKFSQFTPWYKPHHSGGGDSFPSGHTALAASLVSLPLLLKTLGRKKVWQIVCGVLCGLFVVATPLSRVMGGYHYLSDVVISLGLTITTFLIVYLALYRNRQPYFNPERPLCRFLRLGWAPDPGAKEPEKSQ